MAAQRPALGRRVAPARWFATTVFKNAADPIGPRDVHGTGQAQPADSIFLISDIPKLKSSLISDNRNCYHF
jgi:hypothetical protein